MRRIRQFAILLALLASNAGAYYHFVRYPSRSAPYTPIYEKFDLNALVGKTVYFYLSDQQPALAPSDSYEALMGQVRQALAVWNAIPTADLRVGFGGVTNISSYQPQTPGGEIVFEELAPGVLGLAGPTVLAPQANGFIPIIRSRVILPKDLSDPSRTTASQSFFTSLVHEIGHALGLQHTLAGSAMSMEVTRSTSRANPLGADDQAGLSVLYPAASLAASTGSITGQVTATDGTGLGLISVVAIAPSGAVVSAFTAPDGSYRIDGLPPSSYIVYAHPLPPSSQPGLGADNIVAPVDSTGAAFSAANSVDTQFYGGVKDPGASTPVVVNAGALNSGVNFQLAPKPALQLYDVTTYSFPGNGAPAIFPAFVNTSSGNARVVTYGQGLAANVGAVSVGVIGGGVQVQSPIPYSPAPSYTEIDLGFTPVTGTGPRHFVFSFNGDIYVRPGAAQLVTRPAPLVRNVQTQTDASGNPLLVLSGDNFAADSRVFLDGSPAASASFDNVTGNLQVSPPVGPQGRQAVIMVDNSDGQSSVFVQPASPVTYTYPAAGAPSIVVSPANAPAGRDTAIDIQGTNTNFVDGRTVVGFGTPDVVTRQVWVLSPTHLLAVVTLSPQASPSATTVSVVSGLQVTTLPAGFTVNALPAGGAAGNAPILSYQGLVDSASSQARVAPGSLVSLYGLNLAFSTTAASSLPLPTTLGGTTVTLNGTAVPLLVVSPAQINLQLPFNLATGPATLRVNNGAQTSQPMTVQIDAVAPGLFRIFSSAGTPVDANNPARLGDTIVIYGTGLGPVTPPATAGVAAPLATANSAVHVNVGGTDLTPAFAGLSPGSTGVYQVNVALPTNIAPAASARVFVTINGQSSNALTIGLRTP